MIETFCCVRMKKRASILACHSPHKSGGLLLEYCVVQAGMELTVLHRLATKSQSSCLIIPNAAVIGANYLPDQNMFDLSLSF